MMTENSAPIRGQLLNNVALASYTSWRVGGVAKQLFKPEDVADLSVFLKYHHPQNEALIYMGLGSNMLIRDGGINGTVIVLQGVLGQIKAVDEAVISAQAGVPCAKFARYCAKNGKGGVEFMAGIPGTIGGALAMNAGACGSETWDTVVAVETINHQGEVKLRQPEEFSISYRQVSMPSQEWFVSAHFKLTQKDSAAALQQIKEYLAQRNHSQPTGQASCGSVFRNPAGDYAGRLIESCGLKGHCIGGASVSQKHANFIINDGSATAADIEQLIFFIRDQVREKCSIELIPEVQMIGEVAHE